MLQGAVLLALLASASPEVAPADVAAVRAAIRKPGASAVLVNVWASWCDPCREEMPDVLRFYREHRDQGLRLILVSADDDAKDAARFLGTLGVDFPSLLKAGDDMAFIDGLDKKWSGSLPASFLYDGRGQKRRFWSGTVTYDELAAELAKLDKKTTNKTGRQNKRRRP
jgi:thiol-disulfide isomerase/thioredoxin